MILSIFKNMILCKLPIPKKLQQFLENAMKEFQKKLAEGKDVAFVIRNGSFNHTGSYFSLKDKDNRRDPSKHVYSEKPLYINQSLFIKSKNNVISIASVLSNFNEDISEFVSDFAVGKDGLHTGDNEKYLRLWHEVEWNQIKIDSKNLEDAKDCSS